MTFRFLGGAKPEESTYNSAWNLSFDPSLKNVEITAECTLIYNSYVPPWIPPSPERTAGLSAKLLLAP